MKNRFWVSCALVVSSSSVLVTACSGDDVTEGPADSGSAIDGSIRGSDGSFLTDSSAPTDGAVMTDAGVSRPPWTLLSINYKSESDLTAFSLDAGAVDGVLTYPANIGFASTTPTGPWLLEQSNDIVTKLDPSAPWRGGPSWNVRGSDGFDGGMPYADPYQVVIGPAGKAYVPRFNRNGIAVIDTTQSGVASAPMKIIDLSKYLDATDEDGVVDMVGAAYVSTQHRLYVLLGTFDLYLTDPVGYYTICGAFHSKIVAIDTDTDALVSPVDGGSGDTDAVTLSGYNATVLVPDLTRNRLLAINAGCNDQGVVDSGVPGALRMREVDALDITTGLATQALDLTSSGFPSTVAPIDANTIAFGARCVRLRRTRASRRCQDRLPRRRRLDEVDRVGRSVRWRHDDARPCTTPSERLRRRCHVLALRSARAFRRPLAPRSTPSGGAFRST